MISRDTFSFITDFYREKKQFILIVTLWLIAGRYVGFGASVLAIGTVVLFKMKGLYEDILFGFFLMLYLSDSYFYPFLFSHFAKPYFLTLMFVFFLLSRSDFPVMNKFYYPFIPFFILILYIIPRSEVTSLCVQKTASIILLYVLIPNYISKLFAERGALVFRYFLLMMGVILIIALVYYAFGWVPVGSGRFRGFFGNPNGMGLHCTTFFLLFMVVKHYFPDLFSRTEVFIFYLIIGLSVYYSSSRNSIFSIFIFLFFYRFYRISPFFGFIILVSIIISYDFLMNNYLLVIQNLGLGTYLRENTLEKGSGRLVAWEFGIEEVKKNIFFGKGLAHEEYIYYANGTQERLNLLGHEGCSHNSYISMMLNTGIFGLIAFFSAFIYKFLRAAKNSIIALPVLYAVLFSANFESWLMGSLNPFTILIVIALTIMTSDEFNTEEKKASFSLL